ncbi:hypothetical protein VTN31DRAFT_6828 [Thermomyces dupontii]|uniref:uncharacterized protein n=1 Tax=Talaromyces thermophilus TaxID=28565 RepID=UPI003743EB52
MTVQCESPQTQLSAFPLLTKNEFCRACDAFVSRVHAASPDGLQALGWRSLKWVPAEACLSISKYVPALEASTLSESDDTQELLEDEDPEARSRSIQSGPSHHHHVVHYDIILSPTYQVPVMYMTIAGVAVVGPAGMDAIYRYLVPPQYGSSLRSSGVMGGISFGVREHTLTGTLSSFSVSEREEQYHPVSGIPAYFVHPCNTANAMRDIVGDRNVGPEEYLLIWLGLVGNCVNLSIPSQLVATHV